MVYKEKRIKEFEKMSLGLFVHWGLYSQLEEGEWTEKINAIPKEDYECLSENFTAKDFSAINLVKTAKEMGAKYITLTTKHHEGFYLYDTKGLSSFDSIHSAAHRDLIREFVDACHQEKIKPFLYMATYDWHDPAFGTSFEQYLENLRHAVKILCTNYGKIGGFWFDGNWSRPEDDWKVDRLYQMIRSYQPKAIIINNTGLDNRGKLDNLEVDAVTYEQGIADKTNTLSKERKYVAKEMSLSINDHWGWASRDLNYKSVPEIIERICQAKSLGSNFLLNIGLGKNGAIPAIFADYLKSIGTWIKQFQEAYYLSEPTKIVSKSNSKDFVLRHNNKLYFFFHDLGVVGNENVVLSGSKHNPRSFINLYHKIETVQWIDNCDPLDFLQDVKKGIVTINAEGNPYGENWVVRVASAVIS